MQNKEGHMSTEPRQPKRKMNRQILGTASVKETSVLHICQEHSSSVRVQVNAITGKDSCNFAWKAASGKFMYSRCSCWQLQVAYVGVAARDLKVHACE
jgi:phosphoribosylformimino-5-aminoimidazole carboxamide ribonucleotide (ProFAR) isomerase